jgi:GTP-binding protein
MKVSSARFIKSSPALKQCPASKLPEFGFIGRSNVGKSSLINMLTGNLKLAKISGNPGKTKTINHFLINDKWYLVDLPGYGYARVPASMREKWQRNTREYISKRESLVCLFVLIDTRLKPQKSDLEFMEYLGINQIPFVRVFTKCDLLGADAIKKAVFAYDKEMLEKWESLPVTYITSSKTGKGKEDILGYIGENVNKLSNKA